MNLKCRYRPVLEICRLRAGRVAEVLGRRAVPSEVLSPSLEWLHFRAIRRGQLPPRLGSFPPSELRPVWDPVAGEPFAAALRLAFLPDARGEAGPALDIPLECFRPLAELASRELARDVRPAEEELGYRLAALPRAEGGAEELDTGVRPAAMVCTAGGRREMIVEETEWDLPFDEAALAGFEDRAGYLPRHSSPGEPPGEPDPEEMPVFIPRRVLEEARELREAAGPVETGGILLGRLHRDRDRREVFLEVTAQIHARNAPAASTRLTFTSETWAAVKDAISLRGRGELQVGWWHTHLAKSWCARCDPANWRRCSLARAFLSEEDRLLHRQVFFRAWSVALVLGDEATADLRWETFQALFGWERGLLRARGFHQFC